MRWQELLFLIGTLLSGIGFGVSLTSDGRYATCLTALTAVLLISVAEPSVFRKTTLPFFVMFTLSMWLAAHTPSIN